MAPTREEIAKLASSPAHEARLLCRHNLVTSTSGLAGDYVQANLVILPSACADDFRMLCARNPVPCPILGATPVGNPNKIEPAACISPDNDDFDIRTDFPCYNVFKTVDVDETDEVDGVPGDPAAKKDRQTRKKVIIEKKTDLLSDWTDDHVGFLIGCSFSFEEALSNQGLRICHQEENKLVAMYRTTIPLLPAGIFHGSNFVVSMRLFRPEEVETVRDTTRPYLAAHGEPVAWGWEGARDIGVDDIDKVYYGEQQTVREGDIPIFWVSLSVFIPFLFQL